MRPKLRTVFGKKKFCLGGYMKMGQVGKKLGRGMIKGIRCLSSETSLPPKT